MNWPETRKAAGVAALRDEAAGRPPEPAPMSGRGTVVGRPTATAGPWLP